jgi:DNA end-binding protein Ku
MPATVWKGYLSFGLVTFPIRLTSAARPETVHFHMLHSKDLSRVKEVWYCAAEDRPLDKSEIVKGYEYSKGEYVVVEPEELEKIAPSTASVMQIMQFVRMEEVDPIFLEKSYWVSPEEATSKPYALLLEAMRQTGYDAVAKMAMHGREHVVVLRPTNDGFVLHTMYFADELHREKQMTPPAKTKFEKKELEMAKTLVQSLAAKFEPDQYHDEYRENVEKLIENKRKGRKVTPIRQPKPAPVTDLMQALQKSLAGVKSAATNARTAAPKKRARKTA